MRPQRLKRAPFLICAAAALLAMGGCTGDALIQPSDPGTLVLSAITTGPNPGPAHYTVSVDGAGAVRLATNGSVSLPDLEPGPHAIGLSGLAANCAVVGANPRTVTIIARSTTRSTVLVTCSAGGGAVQVTAATTGVNLDPDGYTVSADGGTSQHVGLNGSVTFAGLTPGSHTVLLGDLANNCSVNGPNPQTVSVPSGGVAQAPFTIACSMALNKQILFLSTRDAGTTMDVYVMNPDGNNLKRLTSNTLDDGDLAVSPDGTKIVFSRHEGSPLLFHLYMMNSDGSNQVRITNGPFNDTDPEWNPDGSKLVFESDRDGSAANIFIMNPDGTGVTQITTDDNENGDVDWSPDGSKIVYESHPVAGGVEVFVMNANGTGITNLTNGAGGSNPNWSADGTQITFQSKRSGNLDVWIMNANGSNQHRITTSSASDAEPAWSQDGTRIAYENNSVGNFEIWTITTSGTGATRLTNNTAVDVAPEWTRPPPAAVLAARVVPWAGASPAVTAAAESRAVARAALCRTQPAAAACRIRVIEPDWHALR